MTFEDPGTIEDEEVAGGGSEAGAGRPMLDPVEGRVLGCLLEKERTTPDNYPLTLNSLRLACNQSTARHPVVSYDDPTVADGLSSLRQKQLTRIVHSPSNRAAKYRHVIDEALGLRSEELALLCLLLLRGPQTVGELRTRSDRLADLSSLGAVEGVLDGMAARTPPLVRLLERRPGQKEPRYGQLLAEEAGDAGDVTLPAPNPTAACGVTPGGRTEIDSEIEDLRREVAELRRAVETLFDSLGMAPP